MIYFLRILMFKVLSAFIISNVAYAEVIKNTAGSEEKFKFIDNELILDNLPTGPEGDSIKYGYTLISKTAETFGPGSVLKTNLKSRMSCRNCHLGVGTIANGNPFTNTHSIYPQYRAREGHVQTLAQRINACFTHPMQGKPLAENSKEMLAIQMFIKWLGTGKSILPKDPDDRLLKIEFLDRAANPNQGKLVYQQYCMQCHMEDGKGLLNPNKISYKYPPLWGKESFVIGSSLSRLSILSRFIYGAMPYLASKKLDKEQAWDVAAFIMTQERPKWNGSRIPFKNLDEKPFDFPSGPYADSFTIEQHRFGPYQPIINFWMKKNGEKAVSPSGI